MADTRFHYSEAQREALRLLAGPARNVLLFGGSRSGKSFVCCCALVVRALKAPGSRHAVIRRHFNGVRTAIGMDTLPKVLRYRFPGVKYTFNRTESFFSFPNGSEIWLIGLDDAQRAEKILGKEFATLYFNECSELDFSSVQTALTRLAQNVPDLIDKAIFDCNPPGKRHWCYRLFVKKCNPEENTPLAHPEEFSALQINPADNAENLPPGYIENTLGTLSRRQRERFLEGRFSDDVENALWNRALIDRFRVTEVPEVRRIVLGVDPAVTAGSGSDSTGIVAAALGADGHYYVLGDHSCKAPPLVWAGKVCTLARQLEADRVVGEVNNGGDLIEALLRKIDPDLSFKAVRASRGKLARAEPVAALYEQGRVHHVGEFPLLEEEMTGFDPLTSATSPDRMDALVWALTELGDTGRRFILAG